MLAAYRRIITNYMLCNVPIPHEELKTNFKSTIENTRRSGGNNASVYVDSVECTITTYT